NTPIQTTHYQHLVSQLSPLHGPLPSCVCVCVLGGRLLVCVARRRKMPPRSVALSGDYGCLRGSCTEPQRGKCLETGINLFNLALFCPLLHVVCPSQVQPSTCRDTCDYFRFTSAFLFFHISSVTSAGSTCMSVLFVGGCQPPLQTACLGLILDKFIKAEHTAHECVCLCVDR
uniref:Uncharacterized protein n=1 Tax=Sparus aurata TaxID=8175 RepID=A0A671Y4U4_SPAAU